MTFFFFDENLESLIRWDAFSRGESPKEAAVLLAAIGLLLTSIRMGATPIRVIDLVHHRTGVVDEEENVGRHAALEEIHIIRRAASGCDEQESCDGGGDRSMQGGMLQSLPLP